MGSIRKLFGEIFLKDKASKSLDGVNKNMDKAKKGAASLNNVMQGIGAAVVLRGIGSIATASLKAAGDFEQTRVSFDVMLGGVDKADKMLADIEQFSLVTPFTPKTLEDSAKMMLTFGATADSIMPSLQMLGDISGGNAEKMKSLTLAFSQVQSQGKLMGQDLLQMINAGFNPLKTMAGDSITKYKELKDQMSKGLVTFDMVSKSMAKATGEGGKFFRMMEKQSKTWNGLMSTMEGFKGVLLKTLGQQMMKLLKPLLEMIVPLTQKLVTFFTKTEKGAAVLKTVLIALGGAAVVAFGLMTVAAIKLVIALSPILIVAIAIIAAITAIVLIIEDLYVGFKGGESVLWKFLKPFILITLFIGKFVIKNIKLLIKILVFLGKNCWRVGRSIFKFLSWPFLKVIGFIDDFVNYIKTILPRITKFFKELGTDISNFFVDLLPDWAIKLLNKATIVNKGVGAGVQGRASGGPVQANKPFIIGEEGPELFVPSSNGTIIPNGGMTRNKGNVIIKSVVGNLTVVVQNATQAADEIESVILNALNNLSENTLAAELGLA